MSDDRVPVRANVWENLNIGTPAEDQPRPFINGKRLALVYDLSAFEEQNGVLTRVPQEVDVVSGVNVDQVKAVAWMDSATGSQNNPGSGPLAPGTTDDFILNNSVFGRVEFAMASIGLFNQSPGSTIEAIARIKVLGIPFYRERVTFTDEELFLNPNVQNVIQEGNDIFVEVTNKSSSGADLAIDGAFYGAKNDT